MAKEPPLIGIIVSIVDERGPHPVSWYPDNFASVTEIHNSAVKSFSIMIGDKSYRQKSPSDLKCFGILPFPDLDSIGFIHFTGIEDLPAPKPLLKERPITITLLFKEPYRDTLCQKCAQLHKFLKTEEKTFYGRLKNEDDSVLLLLSNLHKKLLKFL
ncbi:MAG: hypothetical protein ACTSRS_12910 [Candidatus Helarchaeota archaeon]